MPAWIPGFFSQVVQLQVIVFTALTCVLLVCLVNMLHLSQERRLLTGQVQQHLLYSVVLLCASLVFPSAALAAVNAVSVKQQMCEKTRLCLFTHVLYVDVLACAKATALLSGWQSCNGARDTVFIYPCPSCHCCVWREFVELGTLGELSNPLTLPTMQNVRAQHTPWILNLGNKSWWGHSANVQHLWDFLSAVK